MKFPALRFLSLFWAAALLFSAAGWLLSTAPSWVGQRAAETGWLWPLLPAVVWLGAGLAVTAFLQPLWRLTGAAPSAGDRERGRAFQVSVTVRPLLQSATLLGTLLLWVLSLTAGTTAAGRLAVMLLFAGQGLCWWLERRLVPETRKLAWTRLPHRSRLTGLPVHTMLNAASFALLMLLLMQQLQRQLLPEAFDAAGRKLLALATGALLVLAALAVGWVAGRDCARSPSRLARRLHRVSELRQPGPLDLDASLVTSLSRAERAFNRLLSRLQDDFRRLQELTENIERTDRTRSRFLASFSHELRTPLNTIIGYADLFLSNLAGNLQPQAREYLQVIMQEGEKLLNIINQLLYLSRLDSGRDPFKPSPVKTRRLCDRLQELAGTAPLTVECPSLASDVELRLDEDKLLRAMRVLVMLAATRQPPAPVHFELRPEGKSLRVHCRLAMPPVEMIYSLPGALWLLGQALARSVSALHGGQSEVRAGSEDAEVIFLLPEALPG